MIHIRTNYQFAAVALLQLVVGFAFGLTLPLLALRSLCRNPMPTVRKAMKPTLLSLNSWQYKCAEEEVAYFVSFRLHLDAEMHRQRIHQQRLQRRRAEISRW